MEKRLNVLAVVFCVLAGIILARFHFLARSGGDLEKKGISTRLERTMSLQPRRGEIFDRDGRRITENRKVQGLFLHDPAGCADRLDAPMRARLGLSADDVEQLRRTESWEVPIAFSPDREEVSNLSRTLSDLHCRNVQLPVWRRHYPHGRSTQFVTGVINAWDKGSSGVESYFEPVLAGTSGSRTVVQNVAGQPIKTLEERHAIPGQDVHLALSAVLSAALEELLLDACQHAPAVRCLAILADAGSKEILAAVKSDTLEWESQTKYLEPGLRGSATLVESKIETSQLPLLLRAVDAIDQGRTQASKDYLRSAASITGGGRQDALREASPPKSGAQRLISICRRLGILEATGVELPREEAASCSEDGIDRMWTTPVKIVQVMAMLVGSGRLAPLTILDRRHQSPAGARKPDVSRRVLFAETTTTLSRELVTLAIRSNSVEIADRKAGVFQFSGQGIALARPLAVSGLVGFGDTRGGNRLVALVLAYSDPARRSAAPSLTRVVFRGALLAGFRYFEDSQLQPSVP